ncbi:type II toxin-antitoxin system Phd/YefM family antitoxin [Phenylobacterium sp.]|uniref:type II toxin-antitoxin system Phd/YefM family antitoxin n=1 Tax=Phenylobacterium sp. TaxID=1871053 RepID=UPI0025DA15B1|nr:type II toxin-antitoxin system Phd/YefM family antitoxin [Phenylobacterium sp.]MBX3481900.1 type II toxin-antitoxin system Phd/YefM family antitoxin [Phenylobacterium sp.]MCW5758747.1 type II toxin-antitoxin system Phd/YefM family antitoxin [Phenylobacterium sp.]
MTDALTVTASEFARNFGRYQHAAIRSRLVVVTSHDRVVGGYLSAEELDHYERLKARERQVLRVDDLDDETLALIAAAEYGETPR